MSHGLDSCIPLLRRWAAHTDAPLPTDWESFSKANLAEAMRIQQADPQLVSLLNGTAGALLRADALEGKIDVAPPSAEEQQRAAVKAQVDELVASAPWGRPGRYEGDEYIAPTQGNYTNQMMLRALAPDVAERMAAEAAPAAADPEALFEARQRAQQHQAAERLRSVQHAGMGRVLPNGI